jgi:putative membrane protein
MSDLSRSSLTLAFAVFALLGCSSHKNQEPPAAQAPQADQTSGAERNYEAPTAPAIQEPAPPGSTAPDERAATTQNPTSNQTTNDQNAAPIADEQIVRILTTVNTGEVEQAQVAQRKAKDARVKKFAAQMIDQHTKAKDKVNKLSKKEQLLPANSTVANDLQDKGSSIMTTLGQVEGPDFDKQYIDAQVQQHQEVLDLINQRLIPSASNAQLKTELENAKKMVDQHLGHARDIQQQLDR